MARMCILCNKRHHARKCKYMATVCDAVTLQNRVNNILLCKNFDYCVLFEVVHHLTNTCRTIAKKTVRRVFDTVNAILIHFH